MGNPRPMTGEDREQMDRLCARIAVEHDSVAFEKLIRELNDLLQKKQAHFQSDKKLSA